LGRKDLLPGYSAILRSASRRFFVTSFFIFCFYKLFNFCCRVLVSVGDYFSRAFVLILVVPTPLQPLQRSCYFQLSARLSTPAKGLCLLTGWMWLLQGSCPSSLLFWCCSCFVWMYPWLCPEEYMVQKIFIPLE
jgi:hypothetical protein